MPTVEFLIEKKTVRVGKYCTLRRAAKKHGIRPTLIMEVVEGFESLGPKTFLEKIFLKGKPANVRMSCQAEVLGDVCVMTDFSPKPARQ